MKAIAALVLLTSLGLAQDAKPLNKMTIVTRLQSPRRILKLAPDEHPSVRIHIKSDFPISAALIPASAPAVKQGTIEAITLVDVETKVRCKMVDAIEFDLTCKSAPAFLVIFDKRNATRSTVAAVAGLAGKNGNGADRMTTPNSITVEIYDQSHVTP